VQRTPRRAPLTLTVRRQVPSPVAIGFASLLFLGCSHSSRDAFPEWKELDQYERQDYSSYLVAAREEPIVLPAQLETYRFIWLRSFHHPIVVRIDCAEACVVTSKQLSGKGGYAPGVLSASSTRTMLRSERDVLDSHVLAMISSEPSTGDQPSGLDGAQWILELAQSNSYRAWSIWSPSDDPQYREFASLCTHMIDLAGIHVPKREFY
jgi:hypothetical protein